jgi:tetratricopeptide (TPR) repeat protein
MARRAVKIRSVRSQEPEPRKKRLAGRSLLWLGVVVTLSVAGVLLGWEYWRSSTLRAIETAIEQRDFDSARRLLEQAASSSPNDADLHLLAAQTARRQGEASRASDLLAKSYRLGAQPEAVKLEQHLAHVQLGGAEGVSRLEKYCHEHRHDPGARLILEALIEGSLVRMELDRTLKLTSLWIDDSRSQAERVQGHLWRAAAFEIARETESAQAEYEKIVELDPEHWMARYALASHLSTVDPRSASEHIAVLESQTPNEVNLHLLKVQWLRAKGELEAAAELLEKVTTTEPENVEALVARAQLEFERGRFAEADHLLQKSEKIAPKHRDVLLARIEFFRLTGRTDEMRTHQQQMDSIEKELTDQLRHALKQRTTAGRMTSAGKHGQPDRPQRAGN